MLLDLFSGVGGSDELVEVNPLQDRISLVDGRCVLVDYKNLVWPSKFGRLDTLPLYQYTRVLEGIYDKPFTFGYLGAVRHDKGLDVTVKSDGEVFFYGLETQSVGNLAARPITIDMLTAEVFVNPMFRVFYTVPLEKLLNEIVELEPRVTRLLFDVNNPYWVVKEIYFRYKDALMEVITRHA